MVQVKEFFLRKEIQEELLAVIWGSRDELETRGALNTRPIFPQDISWLCRRWKAVPKGRKKFLSLVVLRRQNLFRKRGPATTYNHLSLSRHCQIQRCVEWDLGSHYLREVLICCSLSELRRHMPARFSVKSLRGSWPRSSDEP